MARIGEQGMRPGYLSASWCGFVHGESWKTGRTDVRVGETSKTSASFQHFFADVWFRRGFGGFVVAFRGFVVAFGGFVVAFGGFVVAFGGFVVAFGGFVVAFGGFFVAVFCTFHKVSKFPICAALSSDPQRSASV
jgi:hypothetical protein